jgi:hypothetical protein
MQKNKLDAEYLWWLRGFGFIESAMQMGLSRPGVCGIGLCLELVNKFQGRTIPSDLLQFSFGNYAKNCPLPICKLSD